MAAWFAKLLQLDANAQRPQRVTLRCESLEERATPATFIFVLAGFGAPPGDNGMSKLSRELAADPTLADHVRVIDWERRFDVPVSPERQSAFVSQVIQNDLAARQAGSQDKVVLIGHSFGGYLAYRIASRVPGLDRPASTLITFDPIDWRFAHPLNRPLLNRYNQSGLPHSLPVGLAGKNVLNFVQRRPFQGLTKLPLQGFPISGALNDSVLGRGCDGRWGTADDTSHELIDSDLGGDGHRLGIYDVVKSHLRHVLFDEPSPVHAAGAQPAPVALWQWLRSEFPLGASPRIFVASASPRSVPELFHDQGRGLSFSLATTTRGISVAPVETRWVGAELQIHGRVHGWGEAAYGNALFRTLRTFAADLGVERLQWNGRAWCLGHGGEVVDRSGQPASRFFVGFTINGSRALDAAIMPRFLGALRTAWSEETQNHAGWPVLALRPLTLRPSPWSIQPLIRPESDLADVGRLGRFVATAYVGDARTRHGTLFLLDLFPANNFDEVRARYTEGSRHWLSPAGLVPKPWRWRTLLIRSNP